MNEWTVRIRTDESERFLDADAIEQFVALWTTKQKTKEKSGGVTGPNIESFWVESPSGGARWLYDSSGKTWVLAKNIVPVYAISDPAAFNTIMGFEP